MTSVPNQHHCSTEGGPGKGAGIPFSCHMWLEPSVKGFTPWPLPSISTTAAWSEWRGKSQLISLLTKCQSPANDSATTIPIQQSTMGEGQQTAATQPLHECQPLLIAEEAALAAEQQHISRACMPPFHCDSALAACALPGPRFLQKMYA